MKTWLPAALSFGILVAPAAGDEPSVQVDVHVQAGIATDGLDAALRTATRFLSRAGVVGRWRVCLPESPCVNPAGLRPTITVRVRRAAGRGDRPCGRAAQNPDRATGTVLVDYGCVAEKTARARLNPWARTHPYLASLEAWEVVGLVLAHEIGHVAGLRHGGWGVMQAEIDIEDLAALRLDTFGFSRTEAAAMRASLASMIERTARRNVP